MKCSLYTLILTSIAFASLVAMTLGSGNSPGNVSGPQNGAVLPADPPLLREGIQADDIVNGGPPKDGIPSIDHPKFISITQADTILGESEWGMAFGSGDASRFYPFEILVLHEIVNDVVDGRRVLVTYCPLCRTAILFDPLVRGERVEFGTSGKLWNSNLVMYDRKTGSLWSQVLGEAIGGSAAGDRLAVLPSDQTTFGKWKRANPNGRVLSRNTGNPRSYGQDPYGDYYTTPGVMFPLTSRDSRLGEKEFVLGILVDGKARAYWFPAVRKKGAVEDRSGGRTIIARYEEPLGTVRIYEKTKGGMVRLSAVGAYWFAWAAAHPETQLLK